MDLTRVTRKPVYLDLGALLEGADPGVITSAAIAFLPTRTDPDASTVWTSVTYANPTATFVIAGPDAGGSGAVVVPGTCDLWVRATAPTWVDAVLVERINVLDGTALGGLPDDAVSDAYVAGLVTGTTGTQTALDARYVNEGQGAGGALSGTYPSPGLNTAAVDTSVAANVNDIASDTAAALTTWLDAQDIASGETLTAAKTSDYTAVASDAVLVDASGSLLQRYDVATTSGSAVITSATGGFQTTPGVKVGAPVGGLGIPFAATVASIQSGTQLTLSANATSTATNVAVTIGAAKLNVTLPASAPGGTRVAVKKVDASPWPVVVLPSGADTIDGQTSWTLAAQYAARIFQKDTGTGWVLLEGFTQLNRAGGASSYRPGCVVNSIGDSISPPLDGPIISGPLYLRGGLQSDYLWWAHQLSGGKIGYGKQGGIGSHRIDMMLPRLGADALSDGGQFCLIHTATNDASFGHTATTFAGYLKQMCAVILAAGQTPILTSPVPAPSASRVLMDRYRSFITGYARQQGYPLVDFYSLLVDPTSGGYLPAYDNGDGIHPNNAGKKVMGQAIVDALGPFLAPMSPPLMGQNTSTGSLLANGLFLTDTNADGVPDGWTKQGGTASFNLITGDSAIKGSAFRVSDTGSGGFTQATTGVLSGTATGMGGHRIAFSGRSKVVGTGQASLICALQSAAGTTKYTRLYGARTLSPAIATGWQTFYVEGVCPADCNGVNLSFETNGGTAVDVQIAQLGVWDLTANGL